MQDETRDPWGNPAEAGNTVKRDAWERETLEKLLHATLREQRRARRWSVFFRGLLFFYLFVLLAFAWDGLDISIGDDRHTALVKVRGVLADEQPASADNVIRGLRAAFENKAAAGVVLLVNSPGGSPVQAGRIYRELLRLRETHPDTPVYAVLEDVCASGGYYVAAASDAIYADPATIVGSIGVLYNGFGFVEAIDKLGIERRLLTAGEHKGELDAFSSLEPEGIRHTQQMLDTIHRQFIDAVREARGERLTDHEALFSGRVWTGQQGVALGLVDALGDIDYVARELFQAESVVDYTIEPPYFERFARQLGSTLIAQVVELTAGWPAALR